MRRTGTRALSTQGAAWWRRGGSADSAGSGEAWRVGLTAGCAVALVSLVELLLWSALQRAGDLFPIVAATAAVAVGVAVLSMLASFLCQPLWAVALPSTLAFWPFAWQVLVMSGWDPEGARILALGVAAIAGLAAGLVGRTRRGRIAFAGGTAAALAVVLGLYFFAGPPHRPPPPGDHPDIVFLVMDTTRRDHLSLYGYPEPTAPSLVRLAMRAQVYEDAWSPAPWTSPSHASMFTGLLPAEHDTDGQEGVPLPAGLVTLASVLREVGYRTAGFAANPNLHAPGWSRDFDVYRAPWFRGDHTFTPMLNQLFRGSHNHWSVDRTTERVFAQARRWWATNSAGRRFLFLNVLDPHGPYAAPAADRAKFVGGRDCEAAEAISRLDRYQFADTVISPPDVACIAALYDAEIHAMDRQIGSFFDWLADRGELDDTLVVITSDHGERLGERGHVGHLLEMDQHLLRVPLLVRYPVLLPPARIQRRVQLTGLPGFILDTAGIEAPALMAERSFQRESSPLAVAQHRHFGWFIERILERDPSFDTAPYRGDWVFVADSEFALLWAPEQGPEAARLFDYERDANLSRDLSAHRPEVFARLRAVAEGLPRFSASTFSAEDRPLDPHLRERLRALGYAE